MSRTLEEITILAYPINPIKRRLKHAALKAVHRRFVDGKYPFFFASLYHVVKVVNREPIAALCACEFKVSDV